MRLLLESGEGKKIKNKMEGKVTTNNTKQRQFLGFFCYQSLAPDKKKQKKDDQSMASDTLLKAKAEFSHAFSC